MPTAYSRVTVVNGTRRVDLALPGALPLAEVVPQLLRYCDPPQRPEAPAAWTLGRLGGPSLDLTASLEAAGVADGDVLELRPQAAPSQPAYVEDVRDLVEDAVDESGRQWTPASTRAFALCAAAVGLALAMLVPQVRTAGSPATLTVAALISALLVAGAWWAGRQRLTVPGALLVASAGLWGGLAGWLATGWTARPAAVGWAAALLGALLVTGVARLVTPVATAHLAAAAVLAVAAGAAGGFAAAGYDPMTAVRLAAVGAVLIIGVLPRLSLTVGGLAGADYRVRHSGLITERELADRIRHSVGLLYGALVAASLAGVVCGVMLSRSATGWDRGLAVATGIGLVLRSRVFSRVPHVVPPRAAGLLVLAVAGVRLVLAQPGGGVWLGALAAAAAVVLVVLSAVPLSEVTRARVKQLLNWSEFVVVLTLVVVAAGAVGLYDWVAGITSRR